MFSILFRRVIRFGKSSELQITSLKTLPKRTESVLFLNKSSIVGARHLTTVKSVPQSPTLQSIKRPSKKKKINQDSEPKKGLWDVCAYSTAEEYDLEKILKFLQKEDLYKPSTFNTEFSSKGADVVHATAKYEIGTEPREIFLFREGSVVLWNVPELEKLDVLKFLRKFEQSSHPEQLVLEEAEGEAHICDTEDKIVLSQDGDKTLEKYTISNAMALSVKLGTWEANLNQYIDSMELVTEDLKTGKKIKMSQGDVLRRTGELLALRHNINLSSDLLDTPDFYWDREHLEKLYQQTCSYYCITRRTKVINEKLNHCLELVELLSTHLSDRHHVRLEWMIIVLIMVEVVFEFLHYAERVVEHHPEPNRTIHNPA